MGKKSESYQKHRRQALWQIFMPLFLGIALLIFLAVMAVLATSQNPTDGTRFSSISFIWISLPFLFAGMAIIVVAAGLIFGFGKLIGILPVYTGKAQEYASMAPLLARYYADELIQPIIKISGWAEGLKKLKQRLHIP